MRSRHATTVLLMLLPGAVLLVASWAYASNLRPLAEFLGFVCPWLLFAVGVLYHRWDRFHLAVQRTRFYLLNASVRWSATVEIALGETAWKLDGLRAAALRLAGPRRHASVIESAPTRLVLVYDDMTIEARVTQAADPIGDNLGIESLVVKVHPVVFPYRTAHRRFNALVLLLEELERSIRPARSKYNVEVDFDEARNPYFGLYVQRAAPVGSFSWEFVRTLEDGRSQVRVGREKISITTGSLTHLGQMYRQYLALASLDSPE